MKIFSFAEAFKLIAPDNAYREGLISEMDGESIENQYEIKKIIWSAFWELFNAQSSLKMQEIIKMEKTIDLKIALRKARQAIWVDFQDILSGKKVELQQMDDIRSKLQQLISASRGASK